MFKKRTSGISKLISPLDILPVHQGTMPPTKYISCVGVASWNAHHDAPISAKVCWAGCHKHRWTTLFVPAGKNDTFNSIFSFSQNSYIYKLLFWKSHFLACRYSVYSKVCMKAKLHLSHATSFFKKIHLQTNRSSCCEFGFFDPCQSGCYCQQTGYVCVYRDDLFWTIE